MERARGERWWPTVCLSMYSITENIYCSRLSSVAILLQPEPVSYRIIQVKDCVLSPSVLSSYGLPLPPTCLLLAVNEARSYFASDVVTSLWLHYVNTSRDNSEWGNAVKNQSEILKFVTSRDDGVWYSMRQNRRNSYCASFMFYGLIANFIDISRQQIKLW
jgi:hypothetical protein